MDQMLAIADVFHDAQDVRRPYIKARDAPVFDRFP